MKILFVFRDKRFSPRSEQNDEAILRAVASRLQARGHEACFVGEAELCEAGGGALLDGVDRCFSMARSAAALAVLEASGLPVVNSPASVRLCCHRAALDQLMRRLQIAMPPDGADGACWLKRGDGSAETHDDVVFCAREDDETRALAAFRRRGVSEVVRSAHVTGDVVKFYGVGEGRLFRCFYPSDDGISKFGDERRNGASHHYAFDLGRLQAEATRLARAVGVRVFGGDCVVRRDGSFAIIDFNDWPSFSRCRADAATAIAAEAEQIEHT